MIFIHPPTKQKNLLPLIIRIVKSRNNDFPFGMHFSRLCGGFWNGGEQEGNVALAPY